MIELAEALAKMTTGKSVICCLGRHDHKPLMRFRTEAPDADGTYPSVPVGWFCRRCGKAQSTGSLGPSQPWG